MIRLTIFLVFIQIRQAINAPQNRHDHTPNEIKTSPIHVPITITHHEDPKISHEFIPLNPPQQINLVNQKATRKKKGPTIPISLPVTHQLLLPTNLHVIPIHGNIHHSTIHHPGIIRNENVNLVTHTISHSHSASNITHQSQLIPILIPIHHTHLVPIHDLTVIPLHREVHNVETKLSHYQTSMEKRDNDDEEPVNQFRSFYGGYGTGLFFGGHGAGHGFYAYG